MSLSTYPYAFLIKSNMLITILLFSFKFNTCFRNLYSHFLNYSI
nr:MAG TPA: hypothetical protein [Caudoviricetes sp.]